MIDSVSAATQLPCWLWWELGEASTVQAEMCVLFEHTEACMIYTAHARFPALHPGSTPWLDTLARHPGPQQLQVSRASSHMLTSSRDVSRHVTGRIRQEGLAAAQIYLGRRTHYIISQPRPLAFPRLADSSDFG